MKAIICTRYGPFQNLPQTHSDRVDLVYREPLIPPTDFLFVSDPW